MNSYRELLDTVSALESGAKRPGTLLTEPTEPPFDSYDGGAPARFPHENRRAWSDHVCRRLSDAVAREAPTGLGHWPRAWEMVEAPSKALLDLLSAWERTGGEAERRAAIAAAERVLSAWRDAGAAWQAAGCPGGAS